LDSGEFNPDDWLSFPGSGTSHGVKIRLMPEGKEVDVAGVRRVHTLLTRLGVLPGTVLVIRGDRLLTEDAELQADDEIELRSVVSGG
jgi:sulfur carrier protein